MSIKTSEFARVLVILALSFATACGGAQSGGALEAGIYDTEADDMVSRDDFVEALRSADYVIVGESHGMPLDHELEQEVFSILLRGDRSVALGLEMFQRPYQGDLDAYVAGTIDEEELLERTDWKERWGFGAEFYAPLWRAARSQSRPIIALNARRELTKAVAKSGLQSLRDAGESGLVEIDTSNEAYREWLTKIFAAHGMKAESPEVQNFIEAQLVWDETMADSAYQARQREDVDQVLVVAGRGHVERGWGIPSRIERRDPEAKVITVVRPSGQTPVHEMIENDYTRFIIVDAAPSR